MKMKTRGVRILTVLKNKRENINPKLAPRDIISSYGYASRKKWNVYYDLSHLYTKNKDVFLLRLRWT